MVSPRLCFESREVAMDPAADSDPGDDHGVEKLTLGIQVSVSFRAAFSSFLQCWLELMRVVVSYFGGAQVRNMVTLKGVR